MQTDIAHLTEAVVAIARRAGQAILHIYESDFDVETKADNSPLTAADRASHQLIVRELTELTPDIPIWSEESATISFNSRSLWSEFWLVDPLDGTKEFIKRNGEFTVNIALVRNNNPVLGVVHVPVHDRDYYGYAGGGSFLAARDGRPDPITVRKPAASPRRIVGSRSHRGSSLEDYLRQVGEHVMVPMGSSLKICLVAAGDADVYPRLGPTSEWDTAAAQAVVENAGGQVVSLDGKRLKYNTKASPLNPYFIVFGDETVDWVGFAADSAEGEQSDQG
ncbi:MAG: 3'(2'),5'-bisphosphate nucleotidase CysQ [Gammaproteobacteria bacterium]